MRAYMSRTLNKVNFYKQRCVGGSRENLFEVREREEKKKYEALLVGSHVNLSCSPSPNFMAVKNASFRQA
ncbi:hypothetical protein NDU88_000831 [Pleurodeles waltl]|uniref:Uncharacterized protein n=1 Tax=Pleurodeles waltl TaxID=8319 RepID=A0AAV7Q490_PLEWA|nr:hypothetical protein NDU88_000831 [Pleurodeles waltl]